jgi:esterase/lipase/1-acyl-sn-glycerol-3-phosphate acyltransferase
MVVYKEISTYLTCWNPMNPFAYRTTGLLIKALYSISNARINLHGKENIPNGSVIFVINHFTRIETFLMPYLIFKLTKVPVWSLADDKLFRGTFGNYLEKVGAVSIKNPSRDRLIVKTLLTGEARWIIFPEGRMVKNKKIIEKGRHMISYAGGKHPPHTGPANLALRTEFYRRRIMALSSANTSEAERLMDLFQIESIDEINDKVTYIVPVNITYFPLRAQENILSKLAVNLVDNIPERLVEEMMTEGAMLLSGVDIDIRFGKPIDVGSYLECDRIEQDVCTHVSFGFDDPIRSKRQLRRDAVKIMQSYMDSIYDMTTVNHDHLFASILRALPFRKIDEMDLRRRVFLVASQDLKSAGLHLHKSFDTDQTHLLSDDRFKKYSDFISVAFDKGVVREENGRLIKDVSKFSSALDFHRIRIDNPISVMANAVEPLKTLQRLVRRTSWLPSFWVRRRVVKTLVRRELSRYEVDYHAFYHNEESKEKKIGKPYLIKGRSRDLGIVLVHGYMASPAEVKTLAQYFGEKGYWVYAPRLRGHGTSPEDLADRTYQEWITSVDAGYAIIRNICKRVVVGGFSTGGGLALELAARDPSIAGVFAVCPPLRLHHLFSKLVPTVNGLNRLLEKIQIGGIKKEFLENKPEHPEINYLRNPISGIRELERLMRYTHSKLSNIEMPALVVQSQGDPVVDPKGSKEIFEHLGSSDKSYLLLNFLRHGILLGEGSGLVHEAIGAFVDRLIKKD